MSIVRHFPNHALPRPRRCSRSPHLPGGLRRSELIYLRRISGLRRVSKVIRWFKAAQIGKPLVTSNRLVVNPENRAVRPPFRPMGRACSRLALR